MPRGTVSAPAELLERLLLCVWAQGLWDRARQETLTGIPVPLENDQPGRAPGESSKSNCRARHPTHHPPPPPHPTLTNSPPSALSALPFLVPEVRGPSSCSLGGRGKGGNVASISLRPAVSKPARPSLLGLVLGICGQRPRSGTLQGWALWTPQPHLWSCPSPWHHTASSSMHLPRMPLLPYAPGQIRPQGRRASSREPGLGAPLSLPFTAHTAIYVVSPHVRLWAPWLPSPFSRCLARVPNKCLCN